MRYLILIFITAATLAGCAHEMDYADREYGVASMDAYDRMIVHKDYRYADKTDDAMDGIHAEPTMELYQSSFSEGFSQDSVDTTAPGSF